MKMKAYPIYCNENHYESTHIDTPKNWYQAPDGFVIGKPEGKRFGHRFYIDHRNKEVVFTGDRIAYVPVNNVFAEHVISFEQLKQWLSSFDYKLDEKLAEILSSQPL